MLIRTDTPDKDILDDGFVSYGEDASTRDGVVFHSCFPDDARSAITAVISSRERRLLGLLSMGNILWRYRKAGVQVDIIDHQGIRERCGHPCTVRTVGLCETRDEVVEDPGFVLWRLVGGEVSDRHRASYGIARQIASEASPSSPRIIVLPCYGPTPDDMPMGPEEFEEISRFRPGVSVWVVCLGWGIGAFMRGLCDRAQTVMAYMSQGELAGVVGLEKEIAMTEGVHFRQTRRLMESGYFLLVQDDGEAAVVHAMSYD